jgi:hypothetical protein
MWNFFYKFPKCYKSRSVNWRISITAYGNEVEDATCRRLHRGELQGVQLQKLPWNFAIRRFGRRPTRWRSRWGGAPSVITVTSAVARQKWKQLASQVSEASVTHSDMEKLPRPWLRMTPVSQEKHVISNSTFVRNQARWILYFLYPVLLKLQLYTK